MGLENLINTDDLALMEGTGTEVAGVMAITKVAALAYLMFNLYTPPCFAAIGAMNSEMKSAKWLWGGIGICGRPFCCSSFLGDFQPVTVKMAKEQGLSLNPTKISGTCGRLMCCLKYEQNAYDHLLRITPKTGAIVETPEGRGKVVDVNLLRGIIKVQLDKKADAAPAAYDRRDVKVIRDKKIQVEKDELEALKDIE